MTAKGIHRTWVRFRAFLILFLPLIGPAGCHWELPIRAATVVGPEIVGGIIDIAGQPPDEPTYVNQEHVAETDRRDGEPEKLVKEWKPISREATQVRNANLKGVPASSGHSTEAVVPVREGGDIEGRLRTLKKLYEKGLITESEYADKRREILNGL